jgi:hypothetical protein
MLLPKFFSLPPVGRGGKLVIDWARCVSSSVIIPSRTAVRRRSHAMLSSASQIAMEEPMRELRSEVVGDRRVRLLVNPDGQYTVTLEVRGPQAAWEDISLITDRDLALHTASLCYRLRLTEQQAKAIEWRKD